MVMVKMYRHWKHGRLKAKQMDRIDYRQDIYLVTVMLLVILSLSLSSPSLYI